MQFGEGNGWMYRALSERIAFGVACSVAGAGALCSVDTARRSAG